MLTPQFSSCKRRSAKVWLLTPILAALTACTTVTTQSFQVSQNSSVESAQIATDADFSKYDTLHAEEMGIFFPEGGYTPPEDVERIRAIFRTAFLGELENYTIVTSAGPGAMTVQATLIDFRNATTADIISVRSELRDMATPGKILFLMEMRDSVSNAVLARAADSAQTPAIATAEGLETDPAKRAEIEKACGLTVVGPTLAEKLGLS